MWAAYENLLTPAALGEGGSTNAKPTSRGELSPTAARALKAYGGAAVWHAATVVDSTVTVGGVLFQLKGAGIPAHARITVDVQRPHTVIDPVDESGDVGVLDGFGVTILSPGGKVLEQRADAREHLQNATITTRWDRLNLVYFLGYAFWGYYTLPYQLMRSDIGWTELHDGVLQADYGTNLPVHSRIRDSGSIGPAGSCGAMTTRPLPPPAMPGPRTSSSSTEPQMASLTPRNAESNFPLASMDGYSLFLTSSPSMWSDGSYGDVRSDGRGQVRRRVTQ